MILDLVNKLVIWASKDMSAEDNRPVADGADAPDYSGLRPDTNGTQNHKGIYSINKNGHVIYTREM
ncbi:hypothetical protein CQ043_09670 [Paenibacillus sp. MYb63]|nr:hypothetical protein CQ043_09670 [Paenibacillus sp. MYb63]PRA51286.1 hypothetical protein CQ061_02825 [Paenibacillus sp. MYb67]